DFVEVIADQHDRGAGGARVEQTVLHRSAGAHIETAAWTVRDNHLGLTAELAGDNQLLRVAAGEERRPLAPIAYPLGGGFTDRPNGRLAHRRAVRVQPSAVAAVVHLTDAEIIGNREAASETIAETVGGNAGDAEIAQLLRGRAGGVSGTVQLNRSGERTAHS